MALVTRRENGTAPRTYARDPFELARELFGWDAFGATRPAQAYSPAFEVKETADAYVLKADLPGFKDADVDISLHNGVLSIAGTRQAEKKEEGEAYYVYERQYGSFSRSFSLPDVADPDKVDARLDAGVLTVTIGKKAAAQPRKIGLRKE